ncbi:MAG: hypothetical protein D6B25_13610 [Desulfobulbaceae bacterium]|nr:MAG: hypothetical protein D6B25_13610 [Desulfobulbaceae bacterium]
MQKNVIFRFSLRLLSVLIILHLLIIPSYGSDHQQCASKERMLELIESIPKSFSLTDKVNVFIITQGAGGSLSATVDGLSLTFFDSRDADSKKWFTVSNGYKNDGINTDLEMVGCVIAGVNNYDTGEVDQSKDAVPNAQRRYNELVQLTESLTK